MASPAYLQSSDLGDYIELYVLDATGIGGTVLYFTANNYTTTNVVWSGHGGSHVYMAIPIESTDWEKIGPGAASPKPKLRLGNTAARLLLTSILSLGDLVNAKLYRYRTFTKYLDGQEAADSSAYFAPMMYYVEQMTNLEQEVIEWQLSSPLDREGLMLPREQILRDVNAPGVSIYRQR